MPDVTYTAQGTFNSSRQASINVCIPTEPSSGNYTTELYNLSKTTSSGVINVVFCHFHNQNPTPIQHNSFDYRMNFNLDKLNSHPNAVAFDETQNEALFIFLHNNDFTSSDRDDYFAAIETIYNEVKNHGNQSRDGILSSRTNATDAQPRKVGLSLVTKGL